MSNMITSADPVGMSFWLISMALVASTAFFFIERDRVAGKWKTSLTVSGLVTLIAAVHYFYMRDVWVSGGGSPTELRYIDWLLTVPLLMVEFYLVLSAVTVGWSIYPIGYFLGYMGGGADPATLNIVYNLADFVNKIGFGVIIWAAAVADSE